VSCKPAELTIDLLSDTTFGRGERTAGIVDEEVEHDEFGLPFVGGKAVRGLLRNTWLSMQGHFPELHASARRVFGPIADADNTAILGIGDALIEEPARSYFVAAVRREVSPLSARDILSAFTDIRSQTSESRLTGAPARTTLRSTRVILRGLTLVTALTWLDDPWDSDLQCLALAAVGTRHAGLSRNRGRGHVRVAFDGDIEKTRGCARAQQ
jgi:hypothetical protein